MSFMIFVENSEQFSKNYFVDKARIYDVGEKTQHVILRKQAHAVVLWTQICLTSQAWNPGEYK